MRTHRPLIQYLCLLVLLTACSTTSNIPDDDQLFIGLSKISYKTDPGDSRSAVARQNFEDTQLEVEAALATAPNGALFGSSYYRTPFPYGLWIWNAYSGKNTDFARWMTSSFGKQPVLMSWVNPTLRAQVAQSVLHNHGYFHGTVTHEVQTQKNPKKAKIGYNVETGPLTIIDTLEYAGFPPLLDSLITATSGKALLRKGSAFTVSALDSERNRLSMLFRNNGFYFYQPGYATYLADTFDTPAKARLRLQMSDGLDPEVLRPWYIGNVRVNMRRNYQETFTDSLKRRHFTLRYSGRKPPILPRVIMGGIRLRHGQPYSHEKHQETLSNLNSLGLFTMSHLTFTPRDSALSPHAAADTLDMSLDCVFDRPYDFYIETNFKNRTIGRMGPELKLGLTRRNAFRGGEKLDLNLHGSYEWSSSGGGASRSSYEYGADASLEFPRLLAPWVGGNRVRRDRRQTAGQTRPVPRRRFYATPSTVAKVSFNVAQRPGFYRMNVVSGEWTYRWQTSEHSRHEFSPLTVKYQYMSSQTEKFNDMVLTSPYLAVAMADYFIPEMRYTYTYSSSANSRHPFRWEFSIAESGNVTSLAYMAAGRKWNEKDKKLFKNPYAQFLRLETDYVKTWPLSPVSQLVGHVNAGVVWCYGNSIDAPFSEMFYAGGANSVRAFRVRAIGPGAFPGLAEQEFSYIFQNGETKFVANLEYRRKLFGNLNGALFLDAGNVWNLREDYGSSGDEVVDVLLRLLYKDTSLKPAKFFNQLALGTGIGLRYDLDFLILRLDWGVGLHLPYDTGKSGYFNIRRFKDAHTLHFAIGYPF